MIMKILIEDNYRIMTFDNGTVQLVDNDNITYHLTFKELCNVFKRKAKENKTYTIDKEQDLPCTIA